MFLVIERCIAGHFRQCLPGDNNGSALNQPQLALQHSQDMAKVVAAFQDET